MNINKILPQLSLEEKAAFVQGWTTWTTRQSDRLDIPAMFLSDGPHGLRKQEGAADHLGMHASVPATCFPTAAAMANTWDPELGEALGRALGDEAAASRVNMVLGPGLNMKRTPLGGRNFEYFSEDPYLAGKMAAAYVRGIQANGVAACPKHFAVNSQELRRMAMDAVVDERTLREIYLTAFEIVVKEGDPDAIMTSYNMINGCYANENPHLLKDILRDEWGFHGMVVTDWGGDNDHAAGVNAGCSLVMPAPGPDCAIGLVKAVRDGRVDPAALDRRVEEVLTTVDKTSRALEGHSGSWDKQLHHRLARRCAEESIVLLDNDGILPLQKNASVAIIGDFAQQPRYQGAGSSMVVPTVLEDLKTELEKTDLEVMGFAKGYSRTDPKPDTALIAPAVTLAKISDIVLVCLGLEEIAEAEGLDRTSLELSAGQEKLLNEIYKVNRNIVLVLSGGAPFVMPQRHKYKAAIHGYLGGQAGAGAMADALLGRINPCGRLNETWPMRLEDTPAYAYFPSKERTSEYREGLYIGYRYYDTAGVEVRYPFGYGLSYTTFAYKDLHATEKSVTFTLANTGMTDGAEVAQVYVSCPGGKVFRPKKELKGFSRVFLKAGEEKTVTIPLDDKAFRYFNVKTNRWEVETGEYEISVAANVSQVWLKARIHVEGTDGEMPYGSLPGYETGRITRISDEEYVALLGRPIPDGRWQGQIGANDAVCQLYYAKSAVARLVYRIMTRMKNRAEAKGKPDLNLLFLYNMPLRAISKMSGGLASEKMVDDIVFLVNGHFWRGLGRLIPDFLRNMSANRRFRKELESKGECSHAL